MRPTDSNLNEKRAGAAIMKRETKLTIQQKYRLALRALKLANGVMEYCGGDKWERECTEKDRNKFNKLMERLTGKGGAA